MRKANGAEELSQLVREARDEDAAVASLEQDFARLRRARAAQSMLASLPPEDLRSALALRREDLGSEDR